MHCKGVRIAAAKMTLMTSQGRRYDAIVQRTRAAWLLDAYMTQYMYTSKFKVQSRLRASVFPRTTSDL